MPKENCLGCLEGPIKNIIKICKKKKKKKKEEEEEGRVEIRRETRV